MNTYISEVQLATLCSNWPAWLSDAVDEAVALSDAHDWSTEQVVGFAILSTRRSQVGWECKDYADGWIRYDSLDEALDYQEQTGCVMRPVRS